MSDRAYVLINVLPGQTAAVVKALGEIKEIKTIDPCWGKPDIIAIADIRGPRCLDPIGLKSHTSYRRSDADRYSPRIPAEGGQNKMIRKDCLAIVALTVFAFGCASVQRTCRA